MKQFKAAENLEKEEISVEVIDLRTVSPLDLDAILASVEKTGQRSCCSRSTTSSWYRRNGYVQIAERAILNLEAPIRTWYWLQIQSSHLVKQKTTGYKCAIMS